MSDIKEVWKNAKGNKETIWYESNATNDFFKPEPGPRMKEIYNQDKAAEHIDHWPDSGDNWSNKK